MDSEILAPMLVIIILTVTTGATIVLRGALGKALAERLAGRRMDDKAAGRDQDLTELRDELDDVRGQVVELQERMDFAERLLTQQREAEKLPRGEV